jgi:hypothetical protein
MRSLRPDELNARLLDPVDRVGRNSGIFAGRMAAIIGKVFVPEHGD